MFLDETRLVPDTAGDLDVDLRVDFVILKGDSFIRGLLNGCLTSPVLLSES